ncbi:hypothetical protein [Jatrophihabitans sp.]|uniref:hypothetical protein n=1 Tax=Jatrophihabitans sp. TaxID=1932789 RepID=UPI002C9696FE|nr:hypothetical protein [Jatrophihabitans sp.]
MSGLDADRLRRTLGEHGAELRDGRPLADGLLRRLSPGALARLPRIAFIVLRPDALQAGSAVALVAELGRRCAASVLALRVRRLTPADFNALYRHELTLMGRQVWLHHRLFESGPAGLVVLEGDPGGFDSLGERIQAIKGDASPARPAGEDLRSAMGRLSAVHVGLHTADDPGATLCQGTVFFGVAGLAEILDAAGPLAEDVWRPLLETELPAAATMPAAALQLKRRILANLAATGPADSAPARQLRALTAEACATVAPLPYHRQRPAYRDFARAEYPLLRQLIAACESEVPAGIAAVLADRELSPQLRARELRGRVDGLHALYASWYLSGHGAYTVDDGEPLFDALERCNVPVSERVRVLLMSGLQYDVNPVATWSSERLYANDWSVLEQD